MKPVFLLVVACALVAAPVESHAKTTDTAVEAPVLDQSGQRTLYLGVIDSLRRDGKPYAALAHLDSYDAQYPRDPRAQILRANCLADIGDPVGAEAIYHRSGAGPAADEAQAGLGRLYSARQDWTSATAAFAKAVKLRPTYAPYLYELGLSLVRGGRSQEGLFRLRQAMELAPDDLVGRETMIRTLQAAGKTEEVRALAQAESPRSEPIKPWQGGPR